MRALIIALLILPFLADHPGIVESAHKPYSHAQGTSNATIQSPSESEIVQGNVVIQGNATGDGFSSYEIDFASTPDPSGPWFLLQAETTPVVDGTLAVWNTTTIADGDYSLRLLVTYTDSTTIESIIQVRVYNYAPAVSGTPLPVSPSTPGVDTFPYSKTPGDLYQKSTSPTPLPVNPASVTGTQVLSALGKGAGVTLGAFALLAIYLGLQAWINKRD